MLKKILAIAAFASFAVHARAQDDGLNEATGLAPENIPETAHTAPSSSPWRFRPYILIESRYRRRADPNTGKWFGPNLEAGTSLDYAPNSSFTLFIEGRAALEENEVEHKGQLAFDQGGLRWRPTDPLLFVVGKERNRRSPGLIFSPSDFIHTDSNIPGLREERGGTWLARAAWQLSDHSFDVVALPFECIETTGLPCEKNNYRGSVLRYFGHLPAGIDLGLDVGHMEGVTKYGLFAQSFVLSVWKIYGEASYESAEKSQTFLIGTGFDGFTNAALRAEWYKKDLRTPHLLPLFREDSIFILSASLMEMLDQFNATWSFLRSTETLTYGNVFRFEWLASNVNVWGLSFLNLEPKKPFAWQATLDAKLSL